VEKKVRRTLERLSKAVDRCGYRVSVEYPSAFAHMTRANTQQVDPFSVNWRLPIGKEEVSDTVVDDHSAPRAGDVW